MTASTQMPRPVPAGVSSLATGVRGGTEGPAVEFRNIDIAYGKFVAVRDFSLAIDKGSFVTLLGPSGCGKTTILRAIAGLVGISAGEISIGGRRIDGIPIYKRNIGLVFQNYALFPHKTVFDNVAFGLKYRNVPKPEIRQRVTEALEMVRLPGSEKKLPSQLSGGQQQRIALARAIVFQPEVLLLDEPLSALDANMREEMRVEIKKIQKATGITALFVTHDQDEALAMSDRIVVMNSGVMEQTGTPHAVYEQPETRFVASFLGKANLLSGTMTGVAGGRATVELPDARKVTVATDASPTQGAAVTLVLRPQKLAIGRPDGADLVGTVTSASYLGSSVLYEIDSGGSVLHAANLIEGRPFEEGETVGISLPASGVVLLDADGRRLR